MLIVVRVWALALALAWCRDSSETDGAIVSDPP